MVEDSLSRSREKIARQVGAASYRAIRNRTRNEAARRLRNLDAQLAAGFGEVDVDE